MKNNLSERMSLVLSVVVDSYMEYNEPLGSRILAKRYGLDFSPATMRNIMLDLEESGFLTHIRTSGGKIPTEKGYKLYIDTITKNFKPDVKKEFENVAKKDNLKLADVMGEISQIASSVSGLVSLVTLPDFLKMKIKHINFAKISKNMVMFVALFENSMIETRIITTQKEFSENELKDFSEYIANNYQGFSLMEIKDEIKNYINSAKDNSESLIACITQQLENTELVVSGVKNIFEHKEFTKNIEHLRKLVNILEEKKQILDLLGNVIENNKRVMIGTDFLIDDLKDLGLVSSAYKYKKENVGVVSIMGPINMNYKEIISIVESATKKINSMLKIKD